MFAEPAPQAAPQVATAADPISAPVVANPAPAAAPAKPAAKKEIDKSLVTASIKKLPQQLAPLAACFDDAWGSFVKAYGPGAGQVMAREIDFAVQAMLSNTYLIECALKNPAEFVNAIKNVGLTHSTLNPVLKQGYLVPFKSKVQFMPSYMGLSEVLMKTGAVRKIEAHCVYKGDKFTISFGDNGKLTHRPDPWATRTEETMLGAYYYAILTDGTPFYDQMSKAEIDDIKQRSPSAGGKTKSPWDTDYLEMARKTLLRRAFKMIPKTGISEENLKVLNAIFSYDRAVDDELRQQQTALPAKARDRFDEEETEYVEITD